MLINDIVYQILHMPCPSFNVQIYICCEPHCNENCIRNINMDLDRIHQWFIENTLAKHPKKSQALDYPIYTSFANRFTSPRFKSYCVCRQRNKFGHHPIILTMSLRGMIMIKLISIAGVCFLH
jgi:hypothetical protein